MGVGDREFVGDDRAVFSVAFARAPNAFSAGSVEC
jgi:hypothetical protein